MRLSPAVAWLLTMLIAPCAGAVDFQVENSYGGVSVHISMDRRVELNLHNPSRESLQSDVDIKRTDDTMRIVCQPLDGASFDLELTVPFGSTVDVRTKDGKISMDGYPALFVAQTVSGEIALKAPWEASRLRLVTRKQPKNVYLPDGYRFRRGREDELGERRWVLEDRLDDDFVTYGNIRIRSQSTNRVTLESLPLPANSPVKMHWQAARAYEELTAPPPPHRTPTPLAPSAETDVASSIIPDDEAVFSSDVRLVNLQVAVYDEQGVPITGLSADDFTVYEDGVTQRIAAVESEKKPFNLALLFDLSSSTERSRNQMKQVAAGFLSVARPQDKVAAYVLANNWFGVISPLTSDRELLAQRIGDLPNMSGGSPLYDAMVLGYSEELAQLPDERNALVVISDGIDNRLYGIGQPSEVSFTDLKRAASRMNALLYPVYLGPGEDRLQKGTRPYEAYMRFVETAAEAGGRVFSAATLAEFDTVYEEIAEELRSVYSISYYPTEQEFDGEFRSVTVQVEREGAVARTRPGYVAQ